MVVKTEKGDDLSPPPLNSTKQLKPPCLKGGFQKTNQFLIDTLNVLKTINYPRKWEIVVC